MERNCEPMNKNRIEGVAEQDERAKFREALVIKAKRRRSGGCAVTSRRRRTPVGRSREAGCRHERSEAAQVECVLTRGDLASWLKGRRRKAEREVSRGRSSCQRGAKGRRSRRGSALIIDNGLSQMFAQAKLADLENRVKPDEPRQRGTGVAESASRNLGHRVGSNASPVTSTTSTARCGPACRVVWEGFGQVS